MSAAAFLWLFQATSVLATGSFSCDVQELAVDAKSKLYSGRSSMLLQVHSANALNSTRNSSLDAANALDSLGDNSGLNDQKLSREAIAANNASLKPLSSLEADAAVSGQIARAAKLRLSALRALGLAIQKNYCSVLVALLVFLFCCGNNVAERTGQLTFSAFNFVCTVGVIIYVLRSGIFDQWWNGEDVGTMCQILSIWACVTFCITGCLCCCTVLGVGVGYTIKNAVVKKIRLAFEEKESSLTGPRQEYYQSAAFTDLCDELFDKADVDKNGSLDMSELRSAILEISGEKRIAEATPLFFEAFDENGDSTVEQGEFREMMKYFSVLRLEFEKQGVKRIEQHYEVLQLRQTASLAEVKKAYHKLALRWHPDKRTGVSQEIASADMREVQDAYEAICDHLKPK